MRIIINVKSRSFFVATIACSIGLGACSGDDGVTDPDPAPAFDFSGDLIAFRSDRDGQQEIYVITPDGAKFTNLTENPADDSDPA